jgi:hypothetical protein
MTGPGTPKRRNPKRRDPATIKRGADPTVPPRASSKRRADSSRRSAEERALDQGLEESMAGSDPPSIVQPGKNFVGPKG